MFSMGHVLRSSKVVNGMRARWLVSNRWTAVTLGLGLSLGPISASAEDLAAARACTATVDPTQRLACYDAAFAVTPPPPTALFGNNARVEKPRKVAVDLPKEVDAVVTKAAPLGQGLYQLTLDNGQVWATRQGDWSLVFTAGETVNIVRKPLGGYEISKPGKATSVTVRRMK